MSLYGRSRSIASESSNSTPKPAICGRRAAACGSTNQQRELLRVLIEHPGELVPRDVIQRRLWPDGTFVDADTGLNVIVDRYVRRSAMWPPLHVSSKHCRGRDTASSLP